MTFDAGHKCGTVINVSKQSNEAKYSRLSVLRIIYGDKKGKRRVRNRGHPFNLQSADRLYRQQFHTLGISVCKCRRRNTRGISEPGQSPATIPRSRRLPIATCVGDVLAKRIAYCNVDRTMESTPKGETKTFPWKTPAYLLTNASQKYYFGL